MTTEEYLELHKHYCNKMYKITSAKGADYTGGSDPFSNFRRAELMGITSVEKGFLVRMIDKLSRLSTFASSGKLQVMDESVEDTLLDLANYSLLLAAYIKSKGEEK